MLLNIKTHSETHSSIHIRTQSAHALFNSIDPCKCMLKETTYNQCAEFMTHVFLV